MKKYIIILHLKFEELLYKVYIKIKVKFFTNIKYKYKIQIIFYSSCRRNCGAAL